MTETDTWTGYTDEEKEDEIDKLRIVLRHYLLPKYRRLCNYEEVIENRTTITVDGETIYVYHCPCQTIYLDSDAYAIDYEEQEVDKKGNVFLYQDGTTDMGDIVRWEWKRSSIWED